VKRVSLKLKLLFSTLVVCSLIVLVISFVDLLQFRDAEKKRIEREFSNFAQGPQKTIREAVWRYDWDMVGIILASQTSSTISYVQVCDNKVSKCLEFGSRDLTPYMEFDAPIIYNDTSHGKPVDIGRIYLQSHYETFPVHIYSDLPKLLLTNVLSVFSIALILFYLFYRQVVKRLLALEQYTRKIDLQQLGSLPPPITGESGHGRDEIDLLGDAVNGLVEKTKDELERRQSLENQLNQAQKMEALGNLAGGIAHDFNNILAAILGIAELSLIKSKPGTEIAGNLEKIISAGQRAKNLTSQILVFSRKRDESPQEVLNLAVVVEEALQLIRASLPASIRLETDLDANLRTKGDSNRLHQVIMNVITNAKQAIGERCGSIRISLRKVSLAQEQAEQLALPAGGYCRLDIIDNGSGMPGEILSRIFEPFFTTKQTGKGTGMGLAVVHGIVKSHSGAIGVESREGRGTTVSIYLPHTEMFAVAEELAEDIPQGCGQNIVVVDDESQVLETGKAILQNLGYRVTGFCDPHEALNYLVDGGPAELLITDLTMPGMSGVELAGLVKAGRPATPVLLWTGYEDDAASESLANGLLARIVGKPFDIDILARAVHEILGGSHSNESP